MNSCQALQNLSATDRDLFLKYGFGNRTEQTAASIVAAFKVHVQSSPASAAAECSGETITYHQLDQRSDELASRLLASGVRTGDRVVLLVKRSIAMIVGIIGILKTGAAYVPLDGGIVPDKSLGHIIFDAGVKVVVSLKAFATRVAPYDVSTLLLDERNEYVDSIPEFVAPELTGLESAYIVYTSGTTGTPKGVEVMHQSVINLVKNSPGDLDMKPGMRVSQLLNIAFDMAQWECLGSLTNGCTLCLRGSNWLDTLKTVDVVISTPSCIRNYTPADFRPKVIATAGEPCPQELADRWVAHGTKFLNCCGPTETTIINTAHKHMLGERLSIGRPTPNNNIYILDDDMNPVPIGNIGMIWAGGLGIAKGYVNLPERTAAAFKPDVFLGHGNMYRTGDLGQWRTDGSGLLDILGRVDDQVKIKGFRVELDGVAAAMESTPGIHTAVALLVGDELVGVYSPDDIDEAEVRDACSKVQPYYACPSRYVKLRKMPLTSNGKADKRALREMISTLSESSESSTDRSPDSTTSPSTASVASDDDSDPHIFSSVTKIDCEKLIPISWESPRTLIPSRGRLFVNVIQQEGSEFVSRSSIFSRNATRSNSRTARDIATSMNGPEISHEMNDTGTNGQDKITLRSPPTPLGDSVTLDPQTESIKVQADLDIRNREMRPTPLPTSESSIVEPRSLPYPFGDRLLFAIPKKGRLHDKCINLLRGADLRFTKSERLDICLVKNLPVALVFLPAADIPRFVGESNVDIGITGQDMIVESKMHALTTELLPLGFGQCKLQVQVPANGAIERVDELAGKRIATSFSDVAEGYFGQIDERLGTKTKIEYISGSVETACMLGLADGIESGETMRAAGLKAIGTIMSSEAVLISSARPKKPQMVPIVEQLKSRIAGVIVSSRYVLCQFNIRRSNLHLAKEIVPGRRSPTVSSLEEQDWVAVSSMVEREKAATAMDQLRNIGAEDINMFKIENCRA